jgi:hypothetical protein
VSRVADAPAFLPPWRPVTAAESEGLAGQLAREVGGNREHPLHGLRTRAVARRSDTDDVLFAVEGGPAPLAEVHLTWAGPQRGDWPGTEFFPGWEEWNSAR